MTVRQNSASWGLMQRLGEALMYGTQAVVGWVLVARGPPALPPAH